MNTEDLTKSLYEIIDALNSQLPEESRVEKSAETVLIGRNASLDSLGLIMFLTQVETSLAQKHKLCVDLPYEKAVQRNSPFQKISTLVQYISDNMRIAPS